VKWIMNLRRHATGGPFVIVPLDDISHDNGPLDNHTPRIAAFLDTHTAASAPPPDRP
jgi:hypothetical protein